MQITDLRPEDSSRIEQVATLLVESFRGHTPTWPDMATAHEEVLTSFEDGRLSRVALDDKGLVLGWIGGIREYEGNAWELHPLVVSLQHQRQGVGRALVADLEEQVRQQGGATIYLGTDDEDNRTSLSQGDLYPDLLGRIANIKNLGDHPYEFYQKLGYIIIGVLPDANGPGKPDIFMAKRIG